jgi:CheY-like chemotaxis protein
VTIVIKPTIGCNCLSTLKIWSEFAFIYFRAFVGVTYDDQDILFTFKTILNNSGIAAEIFANSHEALIRFAEEDPSYFNLAILDLKMQDINGFQLYKIMKAMTRGTSTTKFLFVSALEYAEEFISILPGFLSPRLIS